MIKFIERHEFLMQLFFSEDGTAYRTTDGKDWEQLMGQSWESVFQDDELIEAYKRWRYENGLRQKSI